MKLALATSAVCAAIFFAPASFAQETIDSQKAPSTDGEGVGSEQQAKKEQKKSSSSGGKQTWGGGPKSGKLSEEWAAWIMSIKDAPKGFIPVPPAQGPGAPKDAGECGRVMKFYFENSDNLQEDGVLQAMESHMGPCLPAAE